VNTVPLLINFLLFQVGWFACVLGGAHGYPFTGSAIAVLIIALHIALSSSRQFEFRLILTATLIGAVFESLIVIAGLATYRHGQWLPYLAPYWMILMWPLFATTLNSSLKWMWNLKIHWLALAGAILAPVAYFAGSRIGAVIYPDIALSLTVIAFSWAVLFPLMVILSQRHRGCVSDSRSISAISIQRGRRPNV
jgi:hypothetical protein